MHRLKIITRSTGEPVKSTGVLFSLPKDNGSIAANEDKV
jgi:hypothetical protein